MGDIDTVRGRIAPGALGRTLMHEHVFVLSTEVQRTWPTDFDEEAQVAEAVRRLSELAASGIETIVDLTVVGLGRRIDLVRRVAEQVDLNIVVATGLYTYDSLPHYFDYRTADLNSTGVDALDEMFMHDVEHGIEGSGVHPAVLKCAMDAPGLTPGVERVLRAVARIHRRTGLPISTHSDAGTRNGLEQQRVLAEEGVDLGRVVIGHAGDSTDIAYLRKMLEAGSYLGMDRFGIDLFCPTEDRVATIVELCRLGWSHRLVLSHDAACHIDWMEEALRKVATPNWHYLHIPHDVLPMLRERGVTEDQIQAMLVENPRAILDHGPGY
jgi:phosphotriesterase-related protein